VWFSAKEIACYQQTCALQRYLNSKQLSSVLSRHGLLLAFVKLSQACEMHAVEDQAGHSFCNSAKKCTYSYKRAIHQRLDCQTQAAPGNIHFCASVNQKATFSFILDCCAAANLCSYCTCTIPFACWACIAIPWFCW